MSHELDDIPHEAEEIQIHNELPNGKRVWWPATIEDVSKATESKGVLAYASVVFHAALDYPAEKCPAEIMSNRTIRHETRTWVEGTWKRPEDSVPDDCIERRTCRSPQHTGDHTTSEERTPPLNDYPVSRTRSSAKRQKREKRTSKKFQGKK